MMGFAAGVMIAASFWSLLDPTCYAKADYGSYAGSSGCWLLLGGFSLRLIDAVVPHLHLGMDVSEEEKEFKLKEIIKNFSLF